MQALILSYSRIPVIEALSFRVDDGWCSTIEGEGIGAHCFGDFGFPFSYGINIFEEGTLAAANTPLVVLFFSLLRLFPYNIALMLYMSTFVAAVLAPCIHVARSAGALYLTAPLGVASLLSYGVLVSFDRGNHVVLFFPILYFLVIYLNARKYGQVSAILIIAGLLKWWGLLLIVIPLALRLYRVVFRALVAIPAIHLSLLFAIPGPKYWEKVKIVLGAVTDGDYAEHVSKYAVSGASMVGRLICAWPGGTECSNTLPRELIPFGSFGVSAISLSLLAVIGVIIRRRGLKDHLALIAVGSIGFMAVPEAATYNMVVASASALLLVKAMLEPSVRAFGAGSFMLGDKMGFLSSLTLASGLVPVGIVHWPGVFEWSPLLGVFGFGSFATVVTPLLYSTFLLSVLFYSIFATPGHFRSRQRVLTMLTGKWPFKQRLGGRNF